MSSTTNIHLKVPFNEKDQAKALGARWNAESKHWYVPQGVDATPFEKWFSNSPLPVASAKTMPISNAKLVNNVTSQPIDDIDAINKKLRDAYEIHENQAF
jgi:hypothetical protein